MRGPIGAARRAALDRALRTAARRAAEPGGLRFTERQLFYELCRVLLPWHRAPRALPYTPAPALRYGEFRALLHRHGEVPGLLPAVAAPAGSRPPAGRHTPEPDLFDFGLPRLLVCESDAVAVMLRANGIPTESACPVYGAGDLPLDAGVSRMLTQAGRATVYVLHDASVRGLAFPARLRARAEVPPEVRVVPLGLRPRQAGAVHLTHGRGPARAPGPDPGPGLDPAPGPALSRWEADWLRRGRFTEVAAVRPASLLRTVHRMVRDVPAAPSQLSELRRARDAGFLTWPTR
ncbi:hypothetical protein [Streptomyces sp. NPDC054784]